MNQDELAGTYTTFEGFRKIQSGSLLSNTLAVKRASGGHSAETVVTFEDRTGRAVDLDTRGSIKDLTAKLAAEKAQRHAKMESPEKEGANRAAAEEERGRGRPKLGVIAREVTLLPRHWEWLASQPGGASVALRKLVEEARKTHAAQDRIRAAHERAYQFMHVIAGNLHDYEEATRALFANDRRKFSQLIKAWPADVRDHAFRLAFGDQDSAPQKR